MGSGFSVVKYIPEENRPDGCDPRHIFIGRNGSDLESKGYSRRIIRLVHKFAGLVCGRISSQRYYSIKHKIRTQVVLCVTFCLLLRAVLGDER